MRAIRITIGTVTINAELLDTPAADALYAALPFESWARAWSGVIYFDTAETLRLPSSGEVVGRASTELTTVRKIKEGDPVQVEAGNA